MLQTQSDDAKLQSADQDEFVFPTEIELAPEIVEYNKTYNKDNCDLKIEKYLYSRHSSEISSFNTFPSDIILRFVIGYRHIKCYSKRLKETDKLFTSYLKWHSVTDFDNILTRKYINNVEISKYLFGSYIYGQDKYGHPLFWDDGLKTLPNANNSIHLKCGSSGMDIVTAYFARIMNEIKISTKKYYKLDIIGYQHSIILNMNNFSFIQALKDRKIHEYYAQRFSELAPEMLHRMYIINAPWIFQKAWKIISKFLHPNTVKKTKICGDNYINELLDEININMIPAKYGGKGKWKINYGSVPIGYPIQITKLQQLQQLTD